MSRSLFMHTTLPDQSVENNKIPTAQPVPLSLFLLAGYPGKKSIHAGRWQEENMLRAAVLFSALAICSATRGDDPEPAEKVVFQDRFSGKLADGWTWVRETPGSLTRAVAGSMVGKAWHVFKDGLVFRVLPGYLHAREN